MDEILQLGDGVPAVDGSTNTSFDLRAWVTMVTGDVPIIADVIGMKRPGSALHPCRTCMIKAETAGPKARPYCVPHSSYDFNNPPLRSEFREVVRSVEEDSEGHCRKTGIDRCSILLELKSLHFPRSFPTDVMHLVPGNIAPTLSALWGRTKLPSDKEGRQPYHLDRKAIKSINSALTNSRTLVPADRHAPRRIGTHQKRYKATEWEAWLKWFSVPLLDQRLNEKCLDNFRGLREIYILATRHSLCPADIELLDSLVVRFVQSYEQLYLGDGPDIDPQRLRVCSISTHYLLHLPSYIRDCGPARHWWRLPMERLCHIIKPTGSKSRLNSRMAKKLVLTEHINHVRYTRQGPVERPTYPALQEPCSSTLTPPHRRSLERLCGNVEKIEFYGKCQLRDDFKVGSVALDHETDFPKVNFRVSFSGPDDDGMKFGTIYYFLRVSSAGRPARQLARITQFDNINMDREKRLASAGNGKGRRAWVDVSYIRSLIGIVKDRGRNIIVTDIDLFE